MSPKYIIRLDDACDTMDHKKWDLVESILDKLNIIPIVGVIPDNRDPSLFLKPKNKNFWRRVHSWHKKKWTIAMHGYQHKFHKVKKAKMILPFYNRSEFVGIKKNEQKKLITNAYNVFLKNKITPKAWMAPGHTFDINTLEALRETTPIRIITDGITYRPYKFKGFTFVPQQIWWPEKKRFGTWTICLHPNTMNHNQILDFY